VQKNILFAVLIATFWGCNSDSEIDPDIDFPTGLKKSSFSAHEATNEADFDEDIIRNLPASFSLTTPPIISQEETSKCVAFSSAYYIVGMYNGVTSKNYDKIGSPEYVYATYKKLNKDNNCDDGCYLFNDDSQGVIGVSEILKQYGTPSWNQMPFVNSSNCSVTNATQTSQAAVNKIAGYFRLAQDEYNDVEELKSWIYSGFPIWFGVSVDQGFMNLKAGKVWSKAKGKDEGGHAMVLVGFDNAKNAFKIANSWGTDWADAGYGWVDYNYFVKLLGKEEDAEIGIMIPNKAQRPNMGKVSPEACGNASWGDLIINNKRNQEVAIEMTGTNYTNNDTDNIDATETQIFIGLPKGSIKVKVLTANKSSVIREYSIAINSCATTELVIN
jgi:hypothetical protein